MFKTQKCLTQHSDIVQIKEQKHGNPAALNLVVRQQFGEFFCPDYHLI